MIYINDGWKQIQRENREKPYIILNHNNHYAGLQKIKEGVLLGLDAEMYSKSCGIQCYKVAVRYVQYTAYTVLIEMMQIVKSGTKGKRVFKRDEEDDQPGRYLQHNPEKTNNGIHRSPTQ